MSDPSDSTGSENSTATATTTDSPETSVADSTLDASSECSSDSDRSRHSHKASTHSITDEDLSEFAPTDLIERPDVFLEDVRGNVPHCSGRGKKTAAVRGYNTERLATVVFNGYLIFYAVSIGPWFDASSEGSHGIEFTIESKSCVQRYPSGPYGRFRIWKHHHEKFVSESRQPWPDTMFVYFFLVYTVEDGSEREVGKLVVPAEQVDDILDKWTVRDHPTMGTRKARDISWYQLLKRLDVPPDVFKKLPLVDLTDGVPIDD